MDSAVRWPLNPGANFWRVDGNREENAFVYNAYNRRNKLSLIPAKLALKLIGGYQKYLRPSIPAGCRFEPSCSEYAKLAISKYGFIKGVCKGLIRLSHCHPFSGKSGYDPLI
jgi:hypothetical protein